jgi:hypothetical protein
MKIGYVFECGPDGGDIKVLKHLASLIIPNAEFNYEALSVKTTLLNECGKAAKRLLALGCEKVFIIWDLHPAWKADKGRPCRHEDKEIMKVSLNKFFSAKELAKFDIIPLCIEQELESWLLADGRILSDYFSRPTHKVKIKNESNPDSIADPKAKLIGYFKKHRGVKYEGTIHAEQIIKKIDNFQKLKGSETFSRFHFKLLGVNP